MTKKAKPKRMNKTRTSPQTKKETSPKRTYSSQEVAEAWKAFKPEVPLSYTLESLEAIRRKNS